MIRALLLSLLTANAYADNMDWNRAPPADWPTLTIKQAVVSSHELVQLCHRQAMEGMYGGCAIPDFASRSCRIYLVMVPIGENWSMSNIEIWEHERGHCRGYDHRGESAMRDAWAAYKHNIGVN